MRHHIESLLKELIANDSALMEWLILWVADVISKYRVLPNIRTSYEMYMRHECKHKIVGFGEKVSYMMKVPASAKDAMSTDKSGQGYFKRIVN